MVSAKPRLYIALYARGHTGAPTREGYHWALLSGPKDETPEARGKRYHVKNLLDPITGVARWVYEDRDIPMHATGMLLVRVLIAKIERPDRMAQVLSGVSVVQGDASWNCKSWVRDTVLALEVDGKCLATARVDWDRVVSVARWYVDLKKGQQRFDGSGKWDATKAPTYDALLNREIVE